MDQAFKNYLEGKGLKLVQIFNIIAPTMLGVLCKSCYYIIVVVVAVFSVFIFVFVVVAVVVFVVTVVVFVVAVLYTETKFSSQGVDRSNTWYSIPLSNYHN